jgi:hypothetical protein
MIDAVPSAVKEFRQHVALVRRGRETKVSHFGMLRVEATSDRTRGAGEPMQSA